MESEPVFTKVPVTLLEDDIISSETWRRLYGRYGFSARELVGNADPEELKIIPGTHTIWAEIKFAAKLENIRHLADLLLRRVRIGILLPFGGKDHLDRIHNMCRSELSWDDEKWKNDDCKRSENDAAEK